MKPGRIDFARINAAALSALPAILNRFAPGGSVRAGEWSGRNPRRSDRKPGSFKVNVRTGLWADFAASESGNDPVSLVAYLTGLPMGETAKKLADMLGVPHG
ncbi:MAG: hypothetical protein H7Y60_12875 [Rhodospirillaceae bacterium]|nr:hypothetical protein [Rhodospirillales bacterium]